VTLTFFALFGSIFILTQYLQSVLGYSPVKAGAILVPHAAVMMVFAPLSPRRVDRFGSKNVIVVGLLVLASSLAAMATLGAGSSVPHVIAVTLLLGLGMAHVMPPATESIMGSLPREKAGVGSAMNDTTRQVGGAVGVAVLGSILSTRYRSGMSAELGATAPASVVDQVSGSIGEALGAVRDLPVAAPLADQIVPAANSSFLTGMHSAVLTAAVVMVVAAAGVWRWLPARAADHVDVAAPVPDQGAAPMAGVPTSVGVVGDAR
jgi:MFS family permease